MDTDSPHSFRWSSPFSWLIQKIGVNSLTVLAILLVAGSLALAFKGRDFYRSFESYRAEKAAKAAMELINAERWEMASQLLQSAIRSMPDQPALLRGVAELFSRAYNDPQTAATFLRRIISRNEGTAQDRRRLAEVLLQSGDLNETRRIFAELPESEKTSRKGLELLSSIVRTTGSITEADNLMRRALMLDPNDKEARLRLAIMDEAQALDNARSTITQTIWDIAAQGDEVAFKAIEFLAGSKSLSSTQAKDLLKLVEKHPHATERIRYLVLAAQLRLSPLDQTSVIARELKRNRGKSADNMFDFLRWLGQEGEHQKILDIVPADSVARDADVFLIYVDALSASNRWKELLNLITTRKSPITEATAHVILAQCYAHLQPDLKEARRQLISAFSTGKKEIPVLMRAAALAENLHLSDVALLCYKSIAESRPAMRLQLLEKVLELQRGDRDAAAMMQTLNQLHDLRPRNRNYSDQLNYLRLVSGTELEIAYEQLVGFKTKVVPDDNIHTSVPPYLLRALAALRLGDITRLKTEVSNFTALESLPAGLRATASGLLTICGRDVDGYRLGEKILSAGLLNEERIFLRRSRAD